MKDDAEHAVSVSEPRTTLSELALLFGRLGVTSFGGPAAHVAMMHDEVVTRRRWLSESHFVDLVSATNLIPGPNSTELAIHIGWARRKWVGLLVAGACFITPAVLLSWLLAYGYVQWGRLPRVEAVLYGIKPVIMAVIVQALIRMAPPLLRGWRERALLLVALAFALLHVHEVIILAFCGVLGVWRGAKGASLMMLAPASVAASDTLLLPTSASVFVTFLKVGSMLFGSGYVIFAFLNAELVERLHSLTTAQLTDAIAAGQITPGPVFSTATFAGYLLHGTAGACAATVGIFLPAFVFVALSIPLLERLRASKRAMAVLEGVNIASLALMAASALQLGAAAMIDVPTTIIAASALIALVRFEINASGLVVAGAVLGAACRLW